MARYPVRRWHWRLLVTTLGLVAGVLALSLGLTLFSPAPGIPDDAAGLRFDSLALPSRGDLPRLTPYRARDGRHLHYRHYPAAAPADVVLVLIHGSAAHSAYLQPLARRVATAGAAHVYTPDLRGHGLKPLRRGDVDYIGQLEHDLRDLIAHLRERHPEAALVLGGHSSGGGLVIRFAGGTGPAPVDGYLLLAPYIHHTAPTMRGETSGWAYPNVPRIIGLTLLNAMGVESFNHLPVIRFNMPHSARDGGETLSYSYRMQRAMHPRDDYRADLAALDAPVRVLVGADDEAFLPGAYRRLFAETVADDVVTVIDGVDHLGLINDPVAATRVIDWLGLPAVTGGHQDGARRR